jgi:hypothetical protein
MGGLSHAAWRMRTDRDRHEIGPPGLGGAIRKYSSLGRKSSHEESVPGGVQPNGSAS